MSAREVPVAEVMPGVTLKLAADDIVTTAICIALVQSMQDDGPSLYVVHTPGTSWITQRGMLQAALDIDRTFGYRDIEDDE